MTHQKFHIPKEWEVRHNEFYAQDPNYLNLDDTSWFQFHEDILQLKNHTKQLIIDLGWHPEFHPGGYYKLVVVRIYPDEDKMHQSWNEPLATFSSKSRSEIVKVLELFLTLQWL